LSGTEGRLARALVVPAGTPHKFVCKGESLRQISIHPVARMETEWLE
jgi:hypothetical protein